MLDTLVHALLGEHHRQHRSLIGWLAGVVFGPLFGYLWYHPSVFGTTWAKETFPPHGHLPKLTPSETRAKYAQATALDTLAGAVLFILPVKSHYVVIAMVSACIHMIGCLQNNLFRKESRSICAVLIESGYWGLNMLVKGFLLAHPPY